MAAEFSILQEALFFTRGCMKKNDLTVITSGYQ